MRASIRNVIAAACVPMLLSGFALAGEGLQVNITNDGTEDIVVTVFDLNTHHVVLENAKINGFTSVPLNLVADATGNAVLSWTASSTDNTSRRCGRSDAVTVGNDETVNVHADGSCSV